MERARQIAAPPALVAQHIERLLSEDWEALARDVGRDPSDSNVAIVRIVADIRVAEAQAAAAEAARTTAVQTRYLAWATVVLAIATVVLVAVTAASA